MTHLLLCAFLALAHASIQAPDAAFSGRGPSFQERLAERPVLAAPAHETVPIPLEATKGSRDGAVPPELLEAAKPFRFERQLGKLLAEPASADGRVRFAVLGDIEPGRFVWSRVLWGKKGVAQRQIRSIQGREVEFSVQLGDMVSAGKPRDYEKLIDVLESVDPEVPYFTTLGNHDRRNPHSPSDAVLYEALLAPANWAFDRGDARFVMLDTTGHGLDERQLAWLERALSTTKRKFVFIHVPPIQLEEFLTLGRGGFKRGSREFTDMVAEHRVSRVYTGHIHGFGTADLKGVRYVLSGGGGSPLYPSPVKKFYHYLTVEAGPAGVRETVHTLSGDSFEVPGPVDVPFATAR